MLKVFVMTTTRPIEIATQFEYITVDAIQDILAKTFLYKPSKYSVEEWLDRLVGIEYGFNRLPTKPYEIDWQGDRSIVAKGLIDIAKQKMIAKLK